MVVIFMYHFT